MKKFMVTVTMMVIIFFACMDCRAQLPQPLSWQVEVETVGDNQFEITATGTFSSNGWHIYDLKDYPGGPNGTTFSVEGEGIEPVGQPTISSLVVTAMDEVFGMEIGTCEGPVVITQRVRTDGSPAEATVTISWQACNKGNCLPPEEFSEGMKLAGSGTAVKASETVIETVETSIKSSAEPSRSLWALILEAIAWGFVALLTPCVFPMVPMTVSFFLKQDKKRGKSLALFFGLSIVALYTIPIAVLIALSLLTGGHAVTADIFNFLATHWLPNLLFFIVFMAFAASFFGAFEITLPSKLVNRSDSKSEKGGLVGAFFVALTLVLVSFSCTGPIVGSVLIKSTQGLFWEPIVTMLAFSLAFSLPFTIFAFAPSLLKKLPKSGGWLGSVKIVLGFVELALGMKFLSVADQTYHWGLLGRETYLAIWIVIFTLLGLYLLGKIRFKHEEPVEGIGLGRLAMAIACLSFVVYMVPGMWGAPLKALSGYLPPITTQDFVLSQGASSSSANTASVRERKYSDFLELPYGIEGYFDYAEALEAARCEGKPLFVDFTGHGCVNCREMEARVWADPRALELLCGKVVVCALYADDKTVVPKEDWVHTPDGKVLKTLGKINSHFALERFGVNAQPYYAVIDPFTEELLVPSRGYDLNVENFIGFLSEAIVVFLRNKQ